MADVPPSRKRYREENPLINFRIDKKLKDELEEILDEAEMTKKEWLERRVRGDLDIANSVRAELENEIYDRGFEDGKEEGKKIGAQKAKEVFEVEVPCSQCGNPSPVRSEEGKRGIKLLVKRELQRGPTYEPAPWDHEDCWDNEYIEMLKTAGLISDPDPANYSDMTFSDI